MAQYLGAILCGAVKAQKILLPKKYREKSLIDLLSL
jgi:hypothetical protein